MSQSFAFRLMSPKKTFVKNFYFLFVSLKFPHSFPNVNNKLILILSYLTVYVLFLFSFFSDQAL